MADSGVRAQVNSHGGFVWYELMTTDIAAAKAFYAKVVGWGVADASMPGMAYALFTVKGASVAGLMDLPPAAKAIGEKSSWLGYVAVDDVDAAADRVKRLGGAVHVPPRNIGKISRFSLVADPQLGTLALLQWLSPRTEPAADPGESGRIRWHELHAADRDKAFAFYAELFGWQKVDSEAEAPDDYQVFSAAGQAIGGMLTKPPTAPIPFWLYYFNTGDVDAAMARVKAGGGRIVNGPLEVSGGGFMAQCTDPQGAAFGLVGSRGPKAVGYFERGAPRDPADKRLRRWSW